MDGSRRTILLFVCGVLLTSTVAVAEDLTSSVVGAWRLVSCKVERSDGSVTDLYGPTPLGILMYDAAGHMSVHLLKPDLPKCGTLDRRKCPDPQARIAFDNYQGYFGRYEFKPSENVVFHHVEGAITPDWIGRSQKRFVKVQGNRLTITTPPHRIGGVEKSFSILVWERAD